MRWASLIAGAAACGLIAYWGARTAYPLFAFDDAYISYRYADNLRSGLGLVYNPGEWVLGTTTPLYTLILSAVGLLVADIARVGHWLGVAAWMACAVGMLLFFRREGSPRAGIVAGLLIAVQPLFLAALGMETTFVAALMVFTAWAWLGGRKILAVALAALLLLARYDAALWLLFLGLEVWRRQRRLPWREAAGVGILIAPWLAFSYWRYGAILPNSAAAKIGQNNTMQSNEVTQSFVEIFASHMTANLSTLTTVAVVLAVLCGLYVIVRHCRGYWWPVGWIAAYLAIYSTLKVSPFPWYLVPPLVALVMICAIGIGHLLGDAPGAAPLRAREPAAPGRAAGFARAGRLLAAGAGLLLALALGASSWVRISGATHVHGHPRWSDYYEAARWLDENAAPDCNVASIEIGILGYYSHCRILDTMGLVSRDVADHLTGWSDTLIYAVTTHWPDYAVVLPGTAWDGIAPQWWFKEHYAPVASFEPTTRDYGPTIIYALATPVVTNYGAQARADYAGGLTLDRVDFDHQMLRPGESLDLWLQFQVHSRQASDYQFTVYLVDAQTGEQKALTTLWPYEFMPAYPTSHWMPGDARRVPVRLAIPQDLSPGAYRLGVLVYDPAQDRPLPLAADPESDYPEVQAGYLRAGQPPDLGRAEDYAVTPVEATWEGGAALLSAGLPVRPLAAGDVLSVRLEWKADGAPERDATVFVHLLDETGKIVAQQDQRPFAGRFPFPAWQAGEVLHDLFQIPLPAELPAGRYGLEIGLYDAAGRLSRSDAAGAGAPQDAVTVPVEVGE